MLQTPSPVSTRLLCHWHQCGGCASPVPAGSEAAALHWLRGCKADTSAMIDLRRSALECSHDPQLSRFTDEAVLAQLAALIASGRLKVCGEPLEAKARSGAGSGAAAPGPPGPVPPVPPVPPKPPPKPKPVVVVTVVIVPSQPVACPGHPLPIKAVGTPGGGSFAWSFSGGSNAQLVDGTRKPIAKGANVNLLGYKPNDADGSIPAQDVSLTVTYTHPNGTATDTKTVPIHKIDFDVTNTAIVAGLTNVTDTNAAASIASAAGVATMSTDPSVKIKLDAACPRKAACAANHRVGWLQTLLTNDRRANYTNTIRNVDLATPIRDALPGATFPFYGPVAAFTGDNDSKTAHHEDSPGGSRSWTDPRAAAPQPPPPTNAQLLSIVFANTFTAWLVVQNVEWSAHDLAGSFAYQRHFDWSDRLACAVNTALPIAAAGVGSNRCNPNSNPPTIAAMVNGKGSSPNLLLPVANDGFRVRETPLP